MTERICKSCGRAFNSRRRDAAYCSCACRQRAHRALSRIKPPDDAEVVRRAAHGKPLAAPGPAIATLQAGISVTGNKPTTFLQQAKWRRPLVWPDSIG
jgi:hypothetical protein